MQHASLNFIERFVPCLRGGLVAPETEQSASSGERVLVSRVASAQVSDSACIALAASPPGVLASALGGLQLRRLFPVAATGASTNGARHNRSLQRTAPPPAELSR
jgi:hypothetical protein